jgi:hypothetical protein
MTRPTHDFHPSTLRIRIGLLSHEQVQQLRETEKEGSPQSPGRGPMSKCSSTISDVIIIIVYTDDEPTARELGIVLAISMGTLWQR